MSTPLSVIAEPVLAPRALAPGDVLIDRYEIRSALGQGGMGVVYRAHDRQADRPVAVKAFFMPGSPGEGAGTQSARRFQREFRALTRLEHPHIVRVYDYGEADGVPFYVMEFIAGTDLSALRHKQGGRFPLRDVIAIGLQLCDALSYIHAQGIVHRDLKPSNVMATNGHPVSNRASAARPDYNLKLVDFGLAKLSDVSINLTESGLVLGTINYMSPEQVQALPLDGRSDLYSFGVLLYELSVGQLPFTGDAPTSIMLQHIFQTPPPLRSLDPSIPPEFQALVSSLLEKRPADRPPSATAVLNVLSSLTSLTFVTPVEVVAPPRADAVLRAGLIGRQAELDRLNDYLAEAWNGEGRLIIVEGEAGVGKTRLATELAGQVRLRGGQRLVATCHEVERVPYGPIAEWFNDAARNAARNGKEFKRIVTGLEPELARLVPQLIGTRGSAAESGLDPQQAKLRFFDAVLHALIRLSERKPLMLLLDDVQWADEATLELLHYLIRNARGQRIFLCATLRREDRDQPTPLAKLLRDLSRLRLFERLELNRLSRPATADLVAALLGLDEAPADLVERLYRESEGNPFFVEELLKALAEEGLLIQQSGGWHVQTDAGLSTLHIPSTIADVIERRLARISTEERGVLNWGAVLGYEFVYAILQPVAGLDEDALLDRLDNLLRAQLIAEVRDPREDKYRFTHTQIREVIYQALSGARRKKMHRTAGEAIEKLYAARLEELSPILAHHYRQGGDAPQAVRYSVQAGDRARKVYANQEAIGFYQQALELAGEAGDADRLIAAHQGLGEVQQLIGDYQAAAANYHAILDLALQSDRGEEARRRLSAEAWWGIGQAHEATSEYVEALHAYGNGMSSLDEADQVERARLLNDIAWIHIRQGDYEMARQQCEHVIESVPHQLDVAATAYEYLGTAAEFQGDFEHAAEDYQHSLAIWEKAGDKSRMARALNSLGILAKKRNRYEEAIGFYQRSLTLCQEIGHSLGAAYLSNNLGTIHLERSDLERADEYFQQSLKAFERIGSRDGQAVVYNNLGEVYLAWGNINQALHFLELGEPIAIEIGDKSLLVLFWLTIAASQLTARRLDEARSYAARAVYMALECGLRFEAGKAQRLLGQIDLEAGQTIKGRQHLAEARQIFEAMNQLPELESTLELLRRAGG